MTKDQEGRQGVGQGAREFSLADSLAELPALSSEDNRQGGRWSLPPGTAEPADPGDRDEAGLAPSLPVTARRLGSHGSRRVAAADDRSVHSQVITANPPDHLPCLTVGASRALLAILEELTHVEILDADPEDDPDVYDV